MQNLVLVALVAGLAAPPGVRCGPDLPQSRPLADELGRAAEGLLMPSERDAPLTFFELGRAGGRRLEPADVLRAAGYDAATPVEVVSLAELFAPATADRAWHNARERRAAARFRHLVEVLDRSLADVRVFKVGAVAKDVYILGRTAGGTYAGLRTRVVET
jgi:hypothetical protein